MQIPNVIATRDLRIRTDSGLATVVVAIGQPEQLDDSSDYQCPYQIVGFGDERIRRAFGVDAIQALQLAMKMIGADLYTSAEARNGQLSWLDQIGELGFPRP